MEERDYFAWASTIKDMQYTKLKKLIRSAGSMEELYYASEKKLSALKEITDKDIRAIREAKEAFAPKVFYDALEKKQIRFTTIADDDFPEKLRRYEHRPYYLFYKGALPDNKKKTVAMIGARACSNYGRSMAKKIAGELSHAGVQVISGMARGIDTYSQLGALSGGENTFAIMGNGVDVIYPVENIELYKQIEKQGGIISEYPPQSPPVAWHFPQRNRIISGLADIVVVIQAKEKSGSLITVEWALEQGKDVYALPGQVDDALSSGCNRLIKAGAGVLTSAQDILEELCLNGEIPPKNQSFQEKLLEKDFCLVYIELSLEPVSITDLMDRTGMNYEQISHILLQLQLEGLVEQPVDNYYAKAAK